MSITGNKKKIHHNIPQLMFDLIQAHITVCFWGRGTGKTEGPGVDFTYYNALSMPRSLGGLVSVSYDKLLTFIVPKIIKGWERLGLTQDVHFWVRKFAPKELRRPKPFLAPSDPKHFIHVFNGSGLQLISLDRMGISNAADLDWIYGDECKLYDYEKFVEVLHTNRGNDEHFGHLSQHHSILLTTDRPQDSSGDWLYEIAKQADPELLEITLMVCQRIFELKEEVEKSRTKKSKEKKLKLIGEFEKQLNQLRRELVYVSEASTLDNIHAIGTDVIKDLKRELERVIFDISVLNLRLVAVEHPFYKDLSDKKHGYNAVHHSYLDSQDFDFGKIKPDCKWYTDINPSEPLDIALDYNAAINNIVTGQGNTKSYKFLHSAYYKKRDGENDQATTGGLQKLLTDIWHPYWASHQHHCKIINFFFDHTAVGGRADSGIALKDTVTNVLDSLGWEVNEIHIGQQPGHKARYIFWERLLNKMDDQYPEFSFNLTQCEYWYNTCKLTRSKFGKERFEKDKSDEKKKGFDQSKAPHITDAGDTLAVGAIHMKYKHTSEPLPTETY